MILMWLGSWALLLFALSESQKQVSSIFAPLQKTLLDKGLEGSLVSQVIRAASVVLGEASPEKSLYAGMGAANLRVVGVRSAVLLMCLSPLGAWWSLLLASLYLNFNGLLFSGLGALSFVPFVKGTKSASYLRLLLFVGLFLIAGDVALRSSSVLLSYLGTSELAFFLADGRFMSVILLCLCGILLNVFVGIEFWSVTLALCLLVANVISVNGALALFAGERTGQMLLFWWRSRGLNQECRRLSTPLALVSVSGVFAGLMLAGFLRGSGGIGFSGDVDVFREKILLFVSLSLVMLAVQFISQMVWGHFAGRVAMNEIQEVKYFSKTWIRQEFISVSMLEWLRGRVHKRLSEIKYHRQGLSSVKEGQIPESLKARLKAEEDSLQSFVQD